MAQRSDLRHRSGTLVALWANISARWRQAHGVSRQDFQCNPEGLDSKWLGFCQGLDNKQLGFCLG